MQDTADLVFGIHISSKIMSFFQPNQLEEILVEWYTEKWIQFWRWHITTLTIWYKLQLCLFWQFWQKGTILTGQARRQWSVLGPIESNFIHTPKKTSTSLTILATTFTCCHDILMLMKVYALIFSGEARSGVPSQPPSLLLLSRLPLISILLSQQCRLST